MRGQKYRPSDNEINLSDARGLRTMAQSRDRRSVLPLKSPWQWQYRASKENYPSQRSSCMSAETEKRVAGIHCQSRLSNVAVWWLQGPTTMSRGEFCIKTWERVLSKSILKKRRSLSQYRDRKMWSDASIFGVDTVNAAGTNWATMLDSLPKQAVFWTAK